MRLNTIHKLTLAIAALVLSLVNAHALPSNWPPAYPVRVTSSAQAKECCKVRAKVALACKDCKTVIAGQSEKGILGWFKADSTHGCSGCRGRITVRGSGEKRGAVAITRHECSKCGPTSAYVCTDHKS